MHHDYVVCTTEVPRGFRLGVLWYNIQAILNKKAYIKSCQSPNGLFQGWAGKCDTLLSRYAKENGILAKEDGALTAGLIDDAVHTIELHGTIEQQQKAADLHFKTTYEVWNKLAAEIDKVKTIFSSIKFIFLNRNFCEGSEVFTPNKIFAKAD